MVWTAAIVATETSRTRRLQESSASCTRLPWAVGTRRCTPIGVPVLCAASTPAGQCTARDMLTQQQDAALHSPAASISNSTYKQASITSENIRLYTGMRRQEGTSRENEHVFVLVWESVWRTYVEVCSCIHLKCLRIPPGCTKPCRTRGVNKKTCLFPPKIIICNPKTQYKTSLTFEVNARILRHLRQTSVHSAPCFA